MISDAWIGDPGFNLASIDVTGRAETPTASCRLPPSGLVGTHVPAKETSHNGDRGVIRRRALLSAAAVLTARQSVAALPVPSGNTLAFRLIRLGSDIGRHTLTFEPRGDNLTVRVTVDALVTLLSIPIVRYSHHVVESWQNSKLTSLTGETNKNGDHEWVNAERTGEGLVVTGSKTQRYVAPEPVGATTYWNKHVLEGPMISLEDGVLLRPKVTPRPTEPIPVASGGSITADHYNLSGAFNVDLWYDQTGTWAGMAFGVKDGSTVHYERL
jgi:hypothetical protein